jgi:hypothetical protein
MSDEKHFEVQDSHYILAEAKEALPPPVSTPAPTKRPKLSAAAIIPVWIIISSAVIIYNNYLYNTLNFKYPVFLVTFHLTFAVRHIPVYLCNKV